MSLVVVARTGADLERVATALDGQLTATVHGADDEIAAHRGLVAILERKAGRVIFNGFPTGVEVGYAMQHGGPYPASTDARSTSVGTAAIARFARPVCYQNAPASLLPDVLQDGNPAGVWRMINGQLSRD